MALSVVVVAMDGLDRSGADRRTGRWQRGDAARAAGCPAPPAVLSLPALALALWALRSLAADARSPSRFRRRLVGGAAGALAYALFCSEVSPAFVLVWYSLGMLVPAGVGARVGRVCCAGSQGPLSPRRVVACLDRIEIGGPIQPPQAEHFEPIVGQGQREVSSPRQSPIPLHEQPAMRGR